MIKSKIYIFITGGNHKSKKANSINKNVIGDDLRYEDYKNVLFNRSCMRHEMNGI